MKMGLGSQEECSPLAVGTAMPMGSWTVATGPILALKRPTIWAAGLLFMPPTETAILEALSIVRPVVPLASPGWGRGFDIGRLGEAERQGGGFQGRKKDTEVLVTKTVVCVLLSGP